MGSNSDGISIDGGFYDATSHHRSGLGGQGMWGLALRNNILETQRLHKASDNNSDDFPGGQEIIQKQDKGKGREMQDGVLLPAPCINGQFSGSDLNRGNAVQNHCATASTRKPSEKPSKKEDILRRANERREELKAELDRVKIQLWETTIEQGVLAQLVKH